MRSAGVVSLAVPMSRVTGLVRESVMARLFGAGFIYDAFMLGFRIPNLTRDLFAEGALSSAFVPDLHRISVDAQQTQKPRAWRIWWPRALIIVVGVVCALGMIFAPVLVHLLAPGFAAVPGKIRAGGAHDAHHVPVPAAGGAGGAGHGRAECVQPVSAFPRWRPRSSISAQSASEF